MACIIEDRPAEPDDEMFLEGPTVSTHNSTQPGSRTIAISPDARPRPRDRKAVKDTSDGEGS